MCVCTQALLQAESKLRSQETEASLLEETASDLSTAAAADEALSRRRAAEKHDTEVAAARRQLALMAAHQQHEQQRAAAEDLAAEQRNRWGWMAQVQLLQKYFKVHLKISTDTGSATDTALARHTWLCKVQQAVDESARRFAELVGQSTYK